jgi:hypothetical protein
METAMQNRLCSALLLTLPALAVAQTCDEPVIPEDMRVVYEAAWFDSDAERRALLEASQRAWFYYRDANCKLLGQREDEDRGAEARAQCIDFMTRERVHELRLLTFTNVRSILLAP